MPALMMRALPTCCQWRALRGCTGIPRGTRWGDVDRALGALLFCPAGSWCESGTDQVAACERGRADTRWARGHSNETAHTSACAHAMWKPCVTWRVGYCDTDHTNQARPTRAPDRDCCARSHKVRYTVVSHIYILTIFTYRYGFIKVLYNLAEHGAQLGARRADACSTRLGCWSRGLLGVGLAFGPRGSTPGSTRLHPAPPASPIVHRITGVLRSYSIRGWPSETERQRDGSKRGTSGNVEGLVHLDMAACICAHMNAS